MSEEWSRRQFLKGIGAAGSLALADRYAPTGARGGTADSFPEQPNLVFIITDQERATQHFPEGWEEAHLPNLVRLKRHGVTFTNAFCNSSMCTPSRATFMTGLYPAQHGVTDTLPEAEHGASSGNQRELDPEMQNLALMLRSAGYRVYYKGKWHLSKPQGDVWTADDLRRYGFDGWDPPDAGEDVAPENYGAGRANHDQRFVDDAVAFLESVNPEEPFALFVSLVNPHDVAAYPNHFDEDFDRNMLYGEIDLPSTVNEDLTANYKPGAHAELLTKLGAGLGPLPTVAKKRNYVNFYGNLLKHVDEQIGKILDALEAPRDGGPPLSDSTLVFRFADHGEMGLAHGGLRQKMFVVYDEAIRVSLIVSNPKLFPTPRTSDALVALVDLMPTLATIAKVPNRDRWEFRGCDFSSILFDPSAPDVQDAILFTFDDVQAGMENVDELVSPPNRIRCVREKGWKYARYFDSSGVESPEFEMYDLASDPLEMENLAHPEHPRYNDPDVVAQRERLAAKLEYLEREKLAPLASAVSAPQTRVPGQIRLWQNYPNPFVPSNAGRSSPRRVTRIRFSLPAAGFVRLEVYNARGQRVTTLVNGPRGRGPHSVDWDGTDAAGNPVAVGVYLYRLRAGDRVLTRQMIVAR